MGGSFLIDGAGGADRLIGTAGSERIDGGSGDDLLVDGAGHDSLAGGDGKDLLLGSAGGPGGTETYIGGAGQDRIALAHSDGSSLEIRGGSASGADATGDWITLVGSRGSLSFVASVLDFERGKDRIDLSQLRDAGNAVLGMDDLVIGLVNGHTTVSFASGVHTLANGSVNVTLTLVGVTEVAATDFSFSAPVLPTGLPALDTALSYL